MATVTMGEKNFEDVVKGHDIVLVDLWASWCGPCRMFAPVFEKVSDKHPDIVFAKVDTEQEQRLSASFGVMAIPTLLAFRDQILVYKQPGALPEHALEDLIAKIRGLDMDEIRDRIAEQDRVATNAGQQ